MGAGSSQVLKTTLKKKKRLKTVSFSFSVQIFLLKYKIAQKGDYVVLHSSLSISNPS